MIKQKTQVFIVHGGMTFKNRKDYIKYLKTRNVSLEKKQFWAGEYIDKKLSKYCDIIKPRMPLQDFAKYSDWKIYFERFIPLLKNNVILIGNSLGGIFLAKYLSENKFPKKIIATYLICAPYDNSIPEEDLVGGFRLKSDLSMLEKNTKKLTLLFSKTDPIVPPSQAKKYEKKLKKAKIIMYNDKNGHFLVPEFPEIVKMIKEDIVRNSRKCYPRTKVRGATHFL